MGKDVYGSAHANAKTKEHEAFELFYFKVQCGYSGLERANVCLNEVLMNVLKAIYVKYA